MRQWRVTVRQTYEGVAEVEAESAAEACDAALVVANGPMNPKTAPEAWRIVDSEIKATLIDDD